ncbi:MAG: hypothetical protein NTZ38_00435 [Candidatus Taylorbacteria bacterium]|nr:hypothetical protein [Candidatus Taylorbacteria bacterium]
MSTALTEIEETCEVGVVYADQFTDDRIAHKPFDGQLGWFPIEEETAREPKTYVQGKWVPLGQ